MGLVEASQADWQRRRRRPALLLSLQPRDWKIWRHGGHILRLAAARDHSPCSARFNFILWRLDRS